MSNSQTLNVPATLIEQRGTYAGHSDLIGKAIRAPQDAPVHPLAFLFGLPGTPAVREGAQGKIIHIDAEGVIWADFGDDERAEPRNTPDGQVRVYDVGNVEGVDDPEAFKLYELVAA